MEGATDNGRHIEAMLIECVPIAVCPFCDTPSEVWNRSNDVAFCPRCKEDVVV